MYETTVDCLAANALAFPARVAFEVLDPRRGTGTPVETCARPVETWTYADAWRRACALAEALADVPVGPHGPMVGLYAPNGVDHVLGYLACQLVGAAAVPVNSRLAPSEVEYVLTDSGASVVLAGGEFLEPARQVAEPLGVRVVDLADVGPPRSTAWPGPAGPDAGERPALVAYTSGTTGFPKGALARNRDLVARFHQWGWTFGLGPEQVLSVPGPIFHASYGGLSQAALAIGARARIMAAFDAATALEEYTHHATWVFLVPSMLAMVAEARRAAGAPPATALQRMLSSGAPGPLALLEEAFELFPNAHITEAYGWTEGGWVTYEVKDRATIVPHSVGWPMSSTEVRVLGPDGRVLGPGEAGEVVARGARPFGGYLGKPEATAAALTAEGFTRSGDVGIWLEDGRLTIVDRVKDMIISGGENVYCAEVERVLHEHPSVLEAAVVGLPDPTWGERVAAVVVARPGAHLEADEVVAFTRQRLAHYKCPREVFVREALPRNPMGKVQKFRLVEELAGG